MSAANGYIYILSNAIFEPGVYKIGVTINHPTERARQLSASSSAPVPFVVAYHRQVRNPFVVEAAIHQILDQYRVNDSREFFRYPLHKIINLFEQYEETTDSFFGADVETPFTNLFASFAAREPGDPYENVLVPEEQRACRRLETELAQQKAARLRAAS